MIWFVSAMQAMVKSITIINENASVVRVLVNSILKHGKVHIQEKRHIDLWADSDCVCPALRLHKEFLIIGHEDVMYTKLLYTPDTLVTRWKQKWVKKFKVTRPFCWYDLWTFVVFFNVWVLAFGIRMLYR